MFVQGKINGKLPVSYASALILIVLIALGSACNKVSESGKTGTDSSNGADRQTADVTIPAPAVRADASKAEMPSEEELQYMTKKTLLEFNNAVRKGDFTGFHDTISKSRQKQLTPENLKQKFEGFVDKSVDFSAISSQKAVFSPEPGISPGKIMKMLVLQGSYNISPAPTFELKYIPEGAEWKLYDINVETKDVK